MTKLMDKVIPIDHMAIFNETGFRSGKIFYSPLFKCWVVGQQKGAFHSDFAEINPPHKIGDTVDGKTVSFVKIVDNNWVIEFN